MLEQDLKNIWKHASNTAQINIDTDLLVKAFDLKMTHLQKKIRNRDLREISASVIGILIFSFFAYEIPFPITRFSCVLSILWFVFVIYKFRKSKLQNTTEILSLPLKAQLVHKKQLLQQQVKLLDSAAYWYAGPSFIINFIFIIGLGNPANYNWNNQFAVKLLPLSVNAKIITLTGLACFYLFTIWINKRAARKDVQPIIESIEVLQQQEKA